jgi:hypothetical protein
MVRMSEIVCICHASSKGDESTLSHPSRTRFASGNPAARRCKFFTSSIFTKLRRVQPLIIYAATSGDFLVKKRGKEIV